MNSILECISYVKHNNPIYISHDPHKNYELTYYIHGQGITTIGGKRFTYGPKSFAVYRPGTVHDEDNLKTSMIIFTRFNYVIPGVSLLENVCEDTDGSLLRCLTRLRNEVTWNRSFSAPMRELILSECIIEAARIQSNSNTLERADIRDWPLLLNYIDEHYYEEIDFHDLAGQGGYSYDRFRHQFASTMGSSPQRYLNLRRIEVAKMMISTCRDTLTQIALDCGFSSSSQFSNIFKKYEGMTPQEYKNNLSNIC